MAMKLTYNIIMVTMCHYVFVPNHECITLKENPNVNHGLGMMMCQGNFINCSKCGVGFSQWRMLCICGNGTYMTLLYFPLNFAVSPNVL